MGGGYLSNAGMFLIQTLFGLYILAVMLRLILQTIRADFHNPVSQALVKLTNPALIPLRRIIPGFGGIDMAAIVLLLLLELVEFALIAILPRYSFPTWPGFIVLSIADLLAVLLNIYLFAIIIQAVLSWVNPHAYNPVTVLIYQITEPLLAPARRMIPPMSGLDLSPMLVIIGLYLVKLLVIIPLSDYGRHLAYYTRF